MGMAQNSCKVVAVPPMQEAVLTATASGLQNLICMVDSQALADACISACTHTRALACIHTRARMHAHEYIHKKMYTGTHAARKPTWFMSMDCSTSPKQNITGWFWFSGLPSPSTKPGLGTYRMTTSFWGSCILLDGCTPRLVF